MPNSRLTIQGKPQYVVVQNTGQVVEINDASVQVVAQQVQGPARDVTGYIPVREASYTLLDADLLAGLNIIGVNYAGDVDIYLPQSLVTTKVIYVKDESLNAGTYNITLHVTP